MSISFLSVVHAATGASFEPAYHSFCEKILYALLPSAPSKNLPNTDAAFASEPFGCGAEMRGSI